MTSDEIANLPIKQIWDPDHGNEEMRILILREIAFQLAKMNEKLEEVATDTNFRAFWAAIIRG